MSMNEGNDDSIVVDSTFYKYLSREDQLNAIEKLSKKSSSLAVTAYNDESFEILQTFYKYLSEEDKKRAILKYNKNLVNRDNDELLLMTKTTRTAALSSQSSDSSNISGNTYTIDYEGGVVDCPEYEHSLDGNSDNDDVDDSKKEVTDTTTDGAESTNNVTNQNQNEDSEQRILEANNQSVKNSVSADRDPDLNDSVKQNDTERQPIVVVERSESKQDDHAPIIRTLSFSGGKRSNQGSAANNKSGSSRENNTEELEELLSLVKRLKALTDNQEYSLKAYNNSVNKVEPKIVDASSSGQRSKQNSTSSKSRDLNSATNAEDLLNLVTVINNNVDEQESSKDDRRNQNSDGLLRLRNAANNKSGRNSAKNAPDCQKSDDSNQQQNNFDEQDRRVSSSSEDRRNIRQNLNSATHPEDFLHLITATNNKSSRSSAKATTEANENINKPEEQRSESANKKSNRNSALKERKNAVQVETEHITDQNHQTVQEQVIYDSENVYIETVTVLQQRSNTHVDQAAEIIRPKSASLPIKTATAAPDKPMNKQRSKKSNEKFNIPIYSALSLINDFNILCKRPAISDYDVNFHIVSSQFESPISIDIGSHSYILIARSEWFRNAFRKFMNETPKHNYDHFSVMPDFANKIIICKSSSKQSSNIVINLELKMISHHIFNSFIRFLYTAGLKIKQENAISLLECSDLFRINSLKSGVNDFLVENIENYSLKEVFHILNLSQKLKLNELKQKSMKAVRKEKRVAIFTQDWQDLLIIKPELVAEIMDF